MVQPVLFRVVLWIEMSVVVSEVLSDQTSVVVAAFRQLEVFEEVRQVFVGLTWGNDNNDAKLF